MGEASNLIFWYDYPEPEVDLLMDNDKFLLPLEIKSIQNFTQDSLTDWAYRYSWAVNVSVGLVWLMEYLRVKLPPRCKKYIVLSNQSNRNNVNE
ncbi:MAG: hypothetical protein OXE78_10850 [Gammaproteobacteria bacterium]|nr:hypothetical protein [Gammaproteobacteria bacterium]